MKLSKNKKMKEISKERIGEIAFAILKEKARGERIPDLNDLKRNLGNASKTLGISSEELQSFWVIVYSEIFSNLLTGVEKISFEK